MKINTVRVSVPEGTGHIQGRNGYFQISAVQVWHGTDTAFIEGIGKRGTVINGGLDLPIEVMDEIAQQWLNARGVEKERRAPSPRTPLSTLLREKLANYAHEAWSGWMKYLFQKSTRNPDGTVTVPAWAVSRWTRQINTSYENLPPDEQRSDLVEADRIIEIVQSTLVDATHKENE